ncbi:MAG: PAQR family membrane homeostasis protein TrhA [Opitutaceae bacterium]
MSDRDGANGPSPAAAGGSHPEAFSLPLFLFTVLATFAVLAGLLRLLLPAVWSGQWAASPAAWVAAFLLLSMLNCFVEYFFHRYVLHTSALPFLRLFYRQHTLHHALTHIVRKRRTGGGGFFFVENRFPIVEPEQGEASFFPWYSFGAFALIVAPLLGALQWLWPSFPWFLAGFAALALSLLLYEVLHAINHWPLEKWQPLIEHPRWGRFWRPAYSFHLRHHAVPDCNESISGWFGLPVADWVFRTCVIPRTVYADGEEWDAEEFRHPRPRWPIAQLDAWSARRVAVRRAAAAAAPARRYSRGEEIANWAAHGFGLGVSLAGLTLLIVFACLRGDARLLVSFGVFGLSVVALSAMSALEQAYRNSGSKPVFRKLKHAAAFFLTASTFTPFLFAKFHGPLDWSLFGVVWAVSGAGALLSFVFGKDRIVTGSVWAYVGLGWLSVGIAACFFAVAPPGGLWLLCGGAVSYLAALGFWRWHGLPYHRTARQLFVVGGYCCHLLAVLLFLLPHAG